MSRNESNFGLVVPTRVWETIGEYLPVGPKCLTKMREVSRSSYLVFSRDEYWRRLTPTEFDGSEKFVTLFHRRLNLLDEGIMRMLETIWDEIEEATTTDLPSMWLEEHHAKYSFDEIHPKGSASDVCYLEGLTF